jgi:endonuclease/exonuclease/phosphatase family metal-dependent hydrolase
VETEMLVTRAGVAMSSTIVTSAPGLKWGAARSINMVYGAGMMPHLIRSAFLALLLVVLVVPLGCQTSRTIRQDPPPPDLSLMTFNVRYGSAPDGPNAWPKRRGLFMQVIRDAAPDVLGLQEALKFQVDEVAAAMPRFGLVRVARDDGKDKGESCAILYDTSRLRLEETATFWLSDTPEVVGSNTWGAACVRICTWARFTDRRGGRGFYVFNTHLDHISQKAREKSVALIIARMASRTHKDEPAILMGDFNSGESNPALHAALASGLIDTFRAIHPDEHTVGTFNDFKNKTDGDKIDYILTPPGVQVLDAAIVRTNDNGRTPSDHFPVTAKVRLAP